MNKLGLKLSKIINVFYKITYGIAIKLTETMHKCTIHIVLKGMSFEPMDLCLKCDVIRIS